MHVALRRLIINPSSLYLLDVIKTTNHRFVMRLTSACAFSGLNLTGFACTASTTLPDCRYGFPYNGPNMLHLT